MTDLAPREEPGSVPVPAHTAQLAKIQAESLAAAVAGRASITALFYSDLASVAMLENPAARQLDLRPTDIVCVSWNGYPDGLPRSMDRLRAYLATKAAAVAAAASGLENRKHERAAIKAADHAAREATKEIRHFRAAYGSDPRGRAILGFAQTLTRVVLLGSSNRELSYLELASRRKSLAHLDHIKGDFKEDIQRHCQRLCRVAQAEREYIQEIYGQTARYLSGWSQTASEGSRRALLVLPRAELLAMVDQIVLYTRDAYEGIPLDDARARPVGPTEQVVADAVGRLGVDPVYKIKRRQLVLSMAEQRLLSRRHSGLTEAVPYARDHQHRLTDQGRKYLELPAKTNLIDDLADLERIYELVMTREALPATLAEPSTPLGKLHSEARRRFTRRRPLFNPLDS